MLRTWFDSKSKNHPISSLRSRRLLTPTLCVYGFAISYPYTDILSYICIQVQAAVTFRDSAETLGKASSLREVYNMQAY